MSGFADEYEQQRQKQKKPATSHDPRADVATPTNTTAKPSDAVLTKWLDDACAGPDAPRVCAGAPERAFAGARAQGGSTKAAPAQKGQPWPGGPAGDKVERINFIDAGTIISMIGSRCRNMDIEKNGLSSHLLNVFSGDFFYGVGAWTSAWIDDGWNDTWSLGLSDVDMQVDLKLSVVNPRERTPEEVESSATASGSATAGTTNSATSTVGGNAEVSGSVGGGGEPGAGAKLGGNLSQADTTTTTTGNNGSRSDTASYKNKRMVADVQMAVTVRYNATIPGADYSPNHGTFNVGDVIYLRKVI
jgi:hypothetical protein